MRAATPEPSLLCRDRVRNPLILILIGQRLPETAVMDGLFLVSRSWAPETVIRNGLLLSLLTPRGSLVIGLFFDLDGARAAG